MGDSEDRGLRRLAIQIAAQLPESERDALRVLQLAAELVSGFMEGRPRPENVIALRDVRPVIREIESG
jgi:hypothetical protein